MQTRSRSLFNFRFFENQLLQPPSSFRQRNLFKILLRPALDFDYAFFQAAPADRYPKRNPDQIGVLELDSRTLFPVVNQDIRTRFLSRPGKSDSSFTNFLVSRIEQYNFDLIRRDIPRPVDSIGVVTLLNHRLKRPAHTDSVTSHDHRTELSIFIGKGRIERFTVRCSEFKNVTDRDRAPDFQRFSREWTRFSRPNATEIAESCDFQIALHIHVPNVKSIFVCTGHAISNQSDRFVRKNPVEFLQSRNRSLNGSKTAGICAENLLHFLGRCRTEKRISERTELRLLKIVLPSQKDDNRLPIADINERLKLLFRRNIVRFRCQIRDRCYARRRKFLKCADRLQIDKIIRYQLALRFLSVRRIATFATKNDIIVPDLRRNHELVRKTSTHHPGISLNDHIIQAATGKKCFISLPHRRINLGRFLIIYVKAVTILHQKFPRAHQSKTRPDFISEFHLDLVKILRKIPIARNLVADQRSDDFLVRRPEHLLHFLLLFRFRRSIPNRIHYLTRRIPARTFLPQLSRMESGQ